MENILPIVTPLSPALGAEISNINLRDDLSESAINIIKDAFFKYCILVIRDQSLEIEDQKRFSKHFGNLFIQEHLLPVTVEGHPECLMLHNNDKKPPGLNYWHTDNSGWEEPPMATVLYAKVTPTVGGDTLFANMYTAYETLSKPMQDFLKKLNAVHDVRKAFGNDYGNLQNVLRKYNIDPDAHFNKFKPIEHPIVRTHPVTRKPALYISEPYVTHISGLTKRESEALLNLLYRHIETQEFIYRHRWKINDLVIWDNRCTQHYAVADYYPAERLMARLNICGERPFQISA